jgi:hypothetical protein
MAKQEETTTNKNSQPSSSFHSFAPGFYLPDVEMVFNKKDKKEAIEWARASLFIVYCQLIFVWLASVPGPLVRLR